MRTAPRVFALLMWGSVAASLLAPAGLGQGATTTAALSGTAGQNGWYLGNVTVALSNPDGVAGTHYSLDGGPSTAYGGPVTVSGDGTHSLTYETTPGGPGTASATIPIDATNPNAPRLTLK